MKQRADIAQQVERILGKDEVPGSNPGISSRSLAEMQDFFVVYGHFLQEFAFFPAFSETSLLFSPDLSQIVSQIRYFFEFFLLIYVRENGISQNLSQRIGVVDGFHSLAGGILAGVGVAVHRGGCLAVPRHGRGNIGIVGQFANASDPLAIVRPSQSLLRQFERCKKSLQRSMFSCISGTTGFFHRQGGRH